MFQVAWTGECSWAKGKLLQWKQSKVTISIRKFWHSHRLTPVNYFSPVGVVIHQRQVPGQRQEHVRLWALWLLCPGQWQLEPSHQDSYWGEALRLPFLPTPHYPKEPSKEPCCVKTREGNCWVTENVLNSLSWDPAWNEGETKAIDWQLYWG